MLVKDSAKRENLKLEAGVIHREDVIAESRFQRKTQSKIPLGGEPQDTYSSVNWIRFLT